MRGIRWLGVGLSLTGAGVLGFACGGATRETAPDDGGTVEATIDAADSCSNACQSDSNCSGGQSCVTGPAGDFCAPTCNTSADCAATAVCTPVNSASNGSQIGACVPRGGECGIVTSDGGAPATCGALLGPTVDAGCTCSTGGGGGGGDGGYGKSDAGPPKCNANGCRFEQYCNPANDTCQPAPIGCGTPGAPYSPGPAPTGTVGASGGSVSRLYFAIVGDTRPPDEDETASYPSAVITQIYQDLQALQPPPSFALSTGDYQYANPTGTQGAAQVDMYLTARAKYSGTLFPAMGNHECTGLTASNCGTGNADGITNNYTTFLTKLLAPIQQTNPYYEIDINAPDGSWTSKFLFVAANAWTQTQANWLDAAMAKATTYTFLIRHEPVASDTAPGVGPAQNIMTQHPYTLSITGHTHTYQHSGPREIIIGNGGAPLSGGVDYGFGMISQQSSGTIAVDVIDYTSGLSDPSFHFVVNPDGSAAQ
jgi:hypothetical protein